MDFFIQTAYAQAGQQAQPFGFLIPMVIIFAAFYFLLIRPQQKKQKAHAALISNLKTGDEILTAGGILGGQFVAPGVLPDRGLPEMSGKAKKCGLLRDQPFFFFHFPVGSQTMIDVSHGQADGQLLPAGGQQVEHGHRVRAAGNRQDDAIAWIKQVLTANEGGYFFFKWMHTLLILGTMGKNVVCLQKDHFVPVFRINIIGEL